MSTFGAIYVAHNPRDGDNVFKVGLTERSVSERMAELTASTSNLGKYDAVGYVVVSDVQEAERRCHERLSYCRVQENREFFQERLETIVRAVRECCHPFEIKDFLPAPIAPEALQLENIVGKALKRGDEDRSREAESHEKVLENIRTMVADVLPLLSRLKETLPSDHMKVVLYSPTLSLERMVNHYPARVDLVDAIFFGRLIKNPIKIAELQRDESRFLLLSNTVQQPQSHPSSHWNDWRVFNDDGRWLRISGSVVLVWADSKRSNDGKFLYGHALGVDVVPIRVKEAGGDTAVATYDDSTSGNSTSARLLSVDDFIRVFATACADNVQLRPKIERYFSFKEGRHGRRYANLYGSYLAQRPIIDALTPYLLKVKAKR